MSFIAKTNLYRILNMALVWAILLVFSACSKGVRDTGQFDSYVVLFENYSQKSYGYKLQVTDIQIAFGSLDNSILAQCSFSPIGRPMIAVNQNTWIGLSETAKEVTLFHELGHCILHRVHDNTENVSGRTYESIMEQWPQLLTDFEANTDAYMDELFIHPNKQDDINP